jgi:hypothetical protein
MRCAGCTLFSGSAGSLACMNLRCRASLSNGRISPHENHLVSESQRGGILIEKPIVHLIETETAMPTLAALWHLHRRLASVGPTSSNFVLWLWISFRRDVLSLIRGVIWYCISTAKQLKSLRNDDFWVAKNDLRYLDQVAVTAVNSPNTREQKLLYAISKSCSSLTHVCESRPVRFNSLVASAFCQVSHFFAAFMKHHSGSPMRSATSNSASSKDLSGT